MTGHETADDLARGPDRPPNAESIGVEAARAKAKNV
jgi:hypothetical protein